MKKDTAVIFIDPLLVLDTQVCGLFNVVLSYYMSSFYHSQEVVSEFAMYFELGQDSFDFHLTEKGLNPWWLEMSCLFFDTKPTFTD